MERKNFDLELIDFDNLNALTEMFGLCFDREPPANYFEWKYLRNPAGRVVGFAAHHEDRVAGFYGVIPEHFVIDGEKTLIYQAMDTMTHPSYQRQGLLTRLATMTHERLISDEGEVFIYAFPGEKAYPGFIKVGWKEIARINYCFLHRAVFKVKKMLRKELKLSFENIQRFDDTFNSYFANKKYPRGKILKFIDQDSLNWRVFDNPMFQGAALKIFVEGRLAGFVIYKLDDKNRCFIHYLDFADDAFYEKYLSTVCDYLFQTSQGDFLFTFEPAQPHLAEAYKKNWFIKNNFSKGPFTYRPLFTGFSNCEKVKNVNFFEKESYDLQPLLRDY